MYISNSKPPYSTINTPKRPPSLGLLPLPAIPVITEVANYKKRKITVLTHAKDKEELLGEKEKKYKTDTSSSLTSKSVKDQSVPQKEYFSLIQHLAGELENVRSLEAHFVESQFAKEVIFPSLAKGIVIRTPFPSEYESIADEDVYYGPDFDLLEHVIGNQGFFKENEDERWLLTHYLLVLHQNGEESPLIASLHYTFVEESGKAKFCSIDAIKVHEDYTRNGYGFLLFACAVLDSLDKKCAYMKLVPSNEGIPFYEKFGFRPGSCTLEAWQALSPKEKNEKLKTDSYIFLFFSEKAIMEPFYERLRSLSS